MNPDNNAERDGPQTCSGQLALRKTIAFSASLIDVGVLHWGFPRSTHPVIEVVDGDKQDIRLRGVCPQLVCN